MLPAAPKQGETVSGMSRYKGRRNSDGQEAPKPADTTISIQRDQESVDGLAERHLVTLVGFDFPYAFPAGLSERLRLNGLSPWKSIWDMLRRRITDMPDNRNNRFQVASNLNEIITGGAAPFWGCPDSATTPYLSPRTAQWA